MEVPYDMYEDDPALQTSVFDTEKLESRMDYLVKMQRKYDLTMAILMTQLAKQERKDKFEWMIKT